MRVAGWQRLLNRYLLEKQAEYQRVGFIAGRLDCVHFAADWVWYSTLADPLGRYRNAYSTEEEGFALLAAHEGSLYQALVNRFGEPVHPAQGMRGDIGYVEIGDKAACGILFTDGGRMRALFLGEGGFAKHRARDMQHVFRVG